MIGLVIAFQEYKLGRWVIGNPWVGLKQFTMLFRDKAFWNALCNTVSISGLNLIFGFWPYYFRVISQ
jgi:putative aldouronate transport system permease protein